MEIASIDSLINSFNINPNSESAENLKSWVEFAVDRKNKIGDVPVLAIVGPKGSGKTYIAIRIAEILNETEELGIDDIGKTLWFPNKENMEDLFRDETGICILDGMKALWDKNDFLDFIDCSLGYKGFIIIVAEDAGIFDGFEDYMVVVETAKWDNPVMWKNAGAPKSMDELDREFQKIKHQVVGEVIAMREREN